MPTPLPCSVYRADRRPGRSARAAIAAGLLACLGWLAAAAPAWAESAGSILALRMGDHGDRTRFVLEMTAAPTFRLSSSASPPRIVIDFPPMDCRAETGAGVGLIDRVSQGDVDGARRFVLELDSPVSVRDVFYLPATAALPYRFVLDLSPADPIAALAADDPPPAEVGTPAADGPSALPVALHPPRPAPLPLSRREVVAIDAGHGGLDPGAIGVDGLKEKNVTLAIARLLRDRLEASGRYAVVMIRDDDTFVSLRDRVQRARQANADIFISLHADSNPDADVRGASVYTLSDQASDREAEMLAARENRAGAVAGVELSAEDDIMVSILIDLAQRSTHNGSDVLASAVVDQLGATTQLVNNTHRRAGFAVLTAPDVPSVLVELGYLSNAEDEALLGTEAYQQTLAAAIASAVDAYFSRAGVLQGL